MKQIQEIIGKMTLEDKIRLCSGGAVPLWIRAELYPI